MVAAVEGGKAVTMSIRPVRFLRQGGYSSAGRALAWHARGQRFDPAYLHQKVKKRVGSKEAAVQVPIV